MAVSGSSELGSHALCVYDVDAMAALASGELLTPRDAAPMPMTEAEAEAGAAARAARRADDAWSIDDAADAAAERAATLMPPLSCVCHDAALDRAFLGTNAASVLVLPLAAHPLRVAHVLRDGHYGSVAAVAHDARQQRLFAAAYDASVAVWALGGAGSEERSRRLTRITGLPSPARALLWLPESDRLALGCDDGVVCEWAAAVGGGGAAAELTRRARPHQGAVTALHLHGGVLRSGAQDGTITLAAWQPEVAVERC